MRPQRKDNVSLLESGTSRERMETTACHRGTSTLESPVLRRRPPHLKEDQALSFSEVQPAAPGLASRKVGSGLRISVKAQSVGGKMGKGPRRPPDRADLPKPVGAEGKAACALSPGAWARLPSSSSFSSPDPLFFDTLESVLYEGCPEGLRPWNRNTRGTDGCSVLPDSPRIYF